VRHSLMNLLALSALVCPATYSFDSVASTQCPNIPPLVPSSLSAMARGVVVALSHGSGPMPLMGQPGDREIVHSLKTRLPSLLRLGTTDAPRAIVLVTAHWSESTPTISNGSSHKLLYDYYGFPPETYKIKYEAPGDPHVAKQVYDALVSVGLKPKMDLERGTGLA